MDLTLIFLFLSALTLLQLTFEDLRTRKVDERPSSFMLGVVILIALINDMALVFIALMLFVLLVLPKIKTKYTKTLGSGDLTILSWIIPGILILNPFLFIFFMFGMAGAGIAMLIQKVSRPPFVLCILVGLLTAFSAFFML